MNLLENASKKLRSQTATCKVCFKNYNPYSFRTFLCETSECNACFSLKNPIFYRFKTGDVNCLALYEYDAVMKEKIYQLKGCYDIELAPTFLQTYAHILSLIYFKRYIVFVPSYFQDNQERGFNHVEEIFKPLKLEKLDLLVKTSHHKQSDQLYKDRKEIKKHLKLANNQDLQGKRILLVDDIYTTGSTINTCIELIKSLHPKSIEVLVLCKVMTFDKQ